MLAFSNDARASNGRRYAMFTRGHITYIIRYIIRYNLYYKMGVRGGLPGVPRGGGGSPHVRRGFAVSAVLCGCTIRKGLVSA